MIDTSSQLEQLHDIVAPPAAHWWPLAAGWYIVAGAVLLIITLLTWWLVRRYRLRRVRRAALRQLSPRLPLNTTTLVLKQACLGYFPSSQMAGLTGSSWRTFLLQQLATRNAADFAELLTSVEQAAYQPHTSELDALQQRYYQFARLWLKRALPPKQRQLSSEANR
ncbi:hypothetical protein PSI9734_00133 [Pseudidiomarina piscicola]|uniref:DUF4381 domain-containing protein n=1 Tax=Pseudidiomarina piscicola TaxID=2614830 RepID=A0A6S6WK88_9GAMM|nr:DUF4381 domain-containing protein [Pseudidiomarina piscicola]CAB0149563.1 hypothetical protein PSI9734_00133 [Pseudidiomarina piscicola]VZT39012.1 hypothetical protein PSI9734_00133 [Pseudomonas aeruginosa]